MLPSNSIDLRAGLPDSDYVTAPLCFPAIFTPSECDAILALGQGRFAYESGMRHPIEGYRTALTHWIPPGPERAFIEERLAFVAANVNRRYRFDISGFEETILLSRYQVGDGFDWHTDAAEKETSTRKLSFSVQLSEPADYEGGALEFMPRGEIPFSRDRGTIIVFPSYLCHRAARVTRGVRSSLVTWAIGPTFR
jgi:PKHD-type hydroxylase